MVLSNQAAGPKRKNGALSIKQTASIIKKI